MKRGLLVAALVLVPFAMLVALGFLFSEPAEPPAQAPVPVPVSREETVKSGPVNPTPQPEPMVPSPAPSPTQALPPLLQPLEADVRRCFADNHLTGRIHVRFTPQRDGRFTRISVDKNSTQNPYLTACIQDLLETAQFTPSPGPDYERVDFTFSF